MTWVVPLALGGFAVLLMAVFTMVAARRRHRTVMQPAVYVGPAILVHDINDDRCTGCDACVAVCPTNVLDLVANKSRVLRFHDCIQCEACMFACPTEALVMFPEGSTPPPLKVPEIDENFQTIVPGQYLIGEVAGKPLVKSAANLGRAVVEHMMVSGLRPGAIGRSDTIVDVAIIGSGPGGLSAALTCIQKGLSYLVLEKEQMIASTIARYPKGKLVMAEPYDTANLSFLPVFDSAKEQLIPIWNELIERVGMRVNQGESVETVARAPDGAFEIRSTVAVYRAQRVVLSIGTRGKPRTLQVPGENLPKIFNLLEDPDEWRGRSVLVVGGGDSAVEAAVALADAGAKVMISYRGKGFNRAAPKNKQTIEQYAGEGRLKAKLGSQILQFDPDSVTVALADGSQKRYPNDGAFVLIGADPPIQWLEKMGIKFVERPHSYQMGKTDDIVRKFARALDCAEDAARAAAAILGGSTGFAPSMPAIDRGAAGVQLPTAMPMGEPVSGPRKWLRSATSIFSAGQHGRASTNAGIQQPVRPPDPKGGKKKFDAPVPLSEFAMRGKPGGPPALPPPGGNNNERSGVHHMHTGHGRRDQLSAGERTRILRMLRDEGGRLADEDSSVYIGAAPAKDYDFDFDDGPAPAPAPSPSGMSPAMLRPDVPAKPAIVVGVAQAQRRAKKPAVGGKRDVPPPSGNPPMHLDNSEESPPVHPGARTPVKSARRQVPPPFGDEPTRQVDDDILSALRNLPDKPAPMNLAPTPTPSKQSPKPSRAIPVPKPAFGEEPTRMAAIDPRAYDETGVEERTDRGSQVRKFPQAQPKTDPSPSRFGGGELEDNGDEATRLASLDSLAAMDRVRNSPNAPHKAPHPPSPSANSSDERTRAVNIRNDPSISDIDWDLD
ncbi:MAG: NAD(P)-binding domain-containing protein [Deltaproteobacteria bacterium]|nr:NAD(P)-binding domain-containing protein [Deltaproteobacteria bacterium]